MQFRLRAAGSLREVIEQIRDQAGLTAGCLTVPDDDLAVRYTVSASTHPGAGGVPARLQLTIEAVTAAG